jgi:HK97 family phage prohead protease
MADDFGDLLRFRDRARSELPDARFAQIDGLSRNAMQQLADGRVPRDGLARSTDEGLRSDETDDGLSIEGYGAVINQVTEIDSWEGSFEEEFLSGSFKRTARNGPPKMQFDHGYSSILGSVPLGRWDAADEDDYGMMLGPGRVFDNWATLPIRDAIIAGAISGQSIRFSVVREEWVDRDGQVIKDERELFNLIFWGEGLDERGPIRRRIKEARVSEAGPVVWPAYSGTTVGMRSGATRGSDLAVPSGVITIDLGRLDDPDQLRSLAGAVYLADRQQRTGRAPTRSTTSTASNTRNTDARPTDTATAPEPARADTVSAPPAPATVSSPGKHSPTQRRSRAAIAAEIGQRVRDLDGR